MNANVYQHFRKDEHPFIDTVGDWLEQVEMQYAPYLTDFLDPRQAYILETLIRQNSDLSFTFMVVMSKQNENALDLSSVLHTRRDRFWCCII